MRAPRGRQLRSARRRFRKKPESETISLREGTEEPSDRNMVGLIHKILFGMIEKQAGNSAVVEIRRRAEVPDDREFRLDENYDDDEWRRLFGATCDFFGITAEQAEQLYAVAFCEDAKARFPMWFRMSSTAREFLERQPAIHNNFATGVQNPEARKAIVDKFRIEVSADETVAHYSSPNRLCGLYVALAQTILDLYGDEATIEEQRCLKKGDSECEIHIHWK